MAKQDCRQQLDTKVDRNRCTVQEKCQDFSSKSGHNYYWGHVLQKFHRNFKCENRSYQLNGVEKIETLSKSVKRASRAKDVNLSKLATKAYLF